MVSFVAVIRALRDDSNNGCEGDQEDNLTVGRTFSFPEPTILLTCGRDRELWPSSGLGPVSRKPRKLFGPGNPKQNPEPYDCRAVLFAYS